MTWVAGANRFRLRRKFQVTQVTIRRANVGHKNRVVKVKDHWHSRAITQALEDGRSEQCCFAKNIDRVKLAQFAQEGSTTSHGASNQPDFFGDVAWLVERGTECRIFKGLVSNLNAELPQVWFPLFETKTLSGRGIVNAGDNCKEPHVQIGFKSRLPKGLSLTGQYSSRPRASPNTGLHGSVLIL